MSKSLEGLQYQQLFNAFSELKLYEIIITNGGNEEKKLFLGYKEDLMEFVQQRIPTFTERIKDPIQDGENYNIHVEKVKEFYATSDPTLATLLKRAKQVRV